MCPDRPEARCEDSSEYNLSHLESPVAGVPPLDSVPEDEAVLGQGEEHEHHAGQQPDLQRRHRVGNRDLRP